MNLKPIEPAQEISSSIVLLHYPPGNCFHIYMKDRDGIEDVYEHECEALRTMSPDEIKAFLDDTAKTMVNMYEEHIESIRESMGKDNGES